MAGEWFCEIAGERLGPLSGQQLRALVDDGRLTSGNRVAESPDGPWVPAGCVNGLFPRMEVRPTSSKKGDLLVATPLEKPDPDSQRAQPPMAIPVRKAPVRKATSAAVPPAPPKPPAVKPTVGGQFGVVADNCAPLVDAFHDGRDSAPPWPDPQTRVWGLRVPQALGDSLILRDVRASGGAAVAVEETVLDETAARVARLEGISLGPEGAAAWAGMENLVAGGRIRPGQSVVVFQTGDPANYLWRPAADR